MKSNNTKIRKTLALLFDMFQSHNKLSITDIMKLLRCNRTSAYNYLKRLENAGYVFKKIQENNRTFYSLVSTDDQIPELISYTPMTADVLRKFAIIRELQNGPIKKDTFRNHFTIYKSEEIHDGDGRIPLDIKITQYYNLLNDLLNEGEIVLNAADQKYYLTGKSIPLQIRLHEDNLINLQIKLSTINAGIPYYEQLQELYSKINILLGNLDHDIPNVQNYLIYGKKMNGLSASSVQLNKITDCDYKNKILCITYFNSHNDTLTSYIATGMIIYSVEKDKFYLLGAEYPDGIVSSNQRHTIIDIANITHVYNIDAVHTCYHSAYFQTMFDDMFSISVEPPTKVIVAFERAANIERKIKYLQMQRKNARVQIQDDTILYTDKISGLADFAQYLRQFGRSAHVITPLSLRERMQKSVELSLTRYKEDSECSKLL